jgi:hypothetical protein
MRKLNLKKVLVPALCVAAGTGIAGMVDAKFVSTLPLIANSQYNKYRGVLFLIGGAFLAFLLGKKSPIATFVGLGMAGYGGYSLVTAIMPSTAVAGIGAAPLLNWQALHNARYGSLDRYVAGNYETGRQDNTGRKIIAGTDTDPVYGEGEYARSVMNS